MIPDIALAVKSFQFLHYGLVHGCLLGGDTMWRQHVPPKLWYSSTNPQDVTTQKKTMGIFTAARTSNCTYCLVLTLFTSMMTNYCGRDRDRQMKSDLKDTRKPSEECSRSRWTAVKSYDNGSRTRSLMTD